MNEMRDVSSKNLKRLLALLVAVIMTIALPMNTAFFVWADEENTVTAGTEEIAGTEETALKGTITMDGLTKYGNINTSITKADILDAGYDL